MFAIKNLKLYRDFSKSLLLQSSVLIIFALFLSGCGRKAPPIPPRQTQPPAVNDLSAIIVRATVMLTWTIPREKEKVISGMSGFIVHRSKKLLSAPDCKDCPVLFKRIADIPIEVKTSKYLKKGNVTYTETLEKGYRYIYMVTVYTEGATSSSSNYVDFIY